jgi:hypothetical protein
MLGGAAVPLATFCVPLVATVAGEADGVAAVRFGLDVIRLDCFGAVTRIAGRDMAERGVLSNDACNFGDGGAVCAQPSEYEQDNRIRVAATVRGVMNLPLNNAQDATYQAKSRAA